MKRAARRNGKSRAKGPAPFWGSRGQAPFGGQGGRPLREFLLEIGCEELPADDLPALLHEPDPQGRGLASAARTALENAGVPWKTLTVFGTFRRLVLRVRGVPLQVRRRAEGPPLCVAFDTHGRLTAAAVGFARKMKVPVSQLKSRETRRGLRLVVEQVTPTERLLAEVVPAILQGIGFSKAMRWDGSGVRFLRPVRWLLALWGAKPVACSFGSVRSGSVTYVPRRFGGKAVRVGRAADYFPRIRRTGVKWEEGLTLRLAAAPELVEGGSARSGQALRVKAVPSRRPKETALRKRLEAAARKAGGRLPETDTEEFRWLLSTLTFLSETPVVQVGFFRQEYLALPPEVLATAMAKHLKLVSVREPEPSEGLRPRFLAVLDGRPAEARSVMSRYERILEARFSDARFFYREDTRRPLADCVTRLDQVTFHRKLGSVGERIPRLRALVRAAAEPFGLGEETLRTALRTAELAKADLVTQMVREFPSLQGVIGGHYARLSGEPEAVAAGIARHYLPRAADDPLPAAWEPALVSLADRLDTLTGFFGVGAKPTGSLDPFALRRQALGLVRILTESPPPLSFAGLSIDTLIEAGIQSWGSKIALPRENVRDALLDFLRERFEWLACGRDGIPRDLVRCVLASDAGDLADARARVDLLHRCWKETGLRSVLLRAAKVAERTGRIVAGAEGRELAGDGPDPGAFEEESERALWAVWQNVRPLLKAQVESRRYEEAIRTYGELHPALHRFFDSVMVMAENPALKRNRLSFMREIHRALADRFADLSQLPLSGVEVA